MKKAQMNLEFVISLVVFITTLMFVTTSVGDLFPSFQSRVNKNVLRSKAWQISEIIFEKGYPEDWDTLGEVSMIGFSADKYYVLNRTKLIAINQCDSASYNKLRELFSIGIQRDFIINVTLVEESGEEGYVYCGPKVVSLVAPKLWITRLALVEEGGKLKIAKIRVVVY